jgi:hypothetical protein
LEKRKEGSPPCQWNSYNDIIEETNTRIYIWGLMLEAKNDNLIASSDYKKLVRIKLGELRNKIGFDNYYQKQFPYCVPLECFEYLEK